MDGITASKPFVAGLGVYLEAVGYDAIKELERRHATFVDLAGNSDVRTAVHRHLGDALDASILVGATHVSAALPVSAEPLPGPKPSFFFAPDHIRGGIDGEALAAFGNLLEWSAGWLEIERRDGPKAVLSAWTEAVTVGLPPTKALSSRCPDRASRPWVDVAARTPCPSRQDPLHPNEYHAAAPVRGILRELLDRPRLAADVHLVALLQVDRRCIADRELNAQGGRPIRATDRLPRPDVRGGHEQVTNAHLACLGDLDPHVTESSRMQYHSKKSLKSAIARFQRWLRPWGWRCAASRRRRSPRPRCSNVLR